MVIAGSQMLQGLDPATGEPIWWCKTRGFGESPIAAKGLVYTSKGGNEPAVLVDPTGEGDVAKTHVKWQIPKVPGDYSSPVIAGDYIYRCRRRASSAAGGSPTAERSTRSGWRACRSSPAPLPRPTAGSTSPAPARAT